MTRAWAPVAMPAGHPAPAGAYSPVARAGNLLFVSGQVPKDPFSGEFVPGEIRAQSRRVLENLRIVLQAASASLEDVVAVTAYLADPADWPVFDEVYRGVFHPPYPARTTVGAQLRGILVEITAIAALGGGAR